MRSAEHPFWFLRPIVVGILTLAGCESSLPTREVPAGNCIAESDCAATAQVCKANQCVACTANSDCASQFCDVYGDSGMPGRCISPSSSYFVDSSDPNLERCGAADGSAQNPFCSIAAVFDRLSMGTPPSSTYLRLLTSPNAYGLPSVTSSRGTLVITGSGSFKAGEAATLVAATDDGTLQIGDGAKVVLDGLVISSPGITVGTGANLTLRRSSVRDLATSATFTMASVTMDRVLLSSNYTGLSFQGCTLNLSNTVATGNWVGANRHFIDVQGGSGSLQFLTVYKNMLTTATSQVLSCQNASAVSIKNSIIAMNGVSQQVSGTCTVQSGSLVVGTSDSSAGQIKQNPSFVDPSGTDLRLKPFDPVNMQYLIDKAVGVSSADKNVDHDFYGTPRPQGAGYDIGAVEFTP
ncbi:MAG: hypothetical protein JNJ46_34865 [Myxococcales bacterium]|nr:hypothetical protein [Myxococcales bacterium]